MSAHLLHALSTILDLLGDIFDELLLFLPLLVLQAKSFILQPTKYDIPCMVQLIHVVTVIPINAHFCIAQLSPNSAELEQLKARPQ